MAPSWSWFYPYTIDNRGSHMRGSLFPIYPYSNIFFQFSFISPSSPSQRKNMFSIFFKITIHFNLALDPIPFHELKFPHEVYCFSISTLFLSTEYFPLHQVSPNLSNNHQNIPEKQLKSQNIAFLFYSFYHLEPFYTSQPSYLIVITSLMIIE